MTAIRRWKHAAVAALLALALLAAGCTAPPATPTPTAAPAGVRVLDPPLTPSDFTLTAHTGEPLKLSDLRGRLALIFFGFTHCPDICPVALANFTLVKRSLGEMAEQVAFVFISVDGARDTPEVMANYLKLFDDTFIGLTGDEATVRIIGRDYGVTFTYEKQSPDDTDYNVAHTASAFLVDRAGQLRRIYSHGTAAEVIAADIAEVAAEPPG